MSRIWSWLSWALAEPAPFPSALGSALKDHTCSVCILRAKPLQGPGSLGHIGRAAWGSTASFLWMLWGLKLKELCEAPMHTKQRLLRQLPLVCLRMPGTSCSLNPLLQMIGIGFSVFSDPQNNRRFYYSPLPNIGSPREGVGTALFVLAIDATMLCNTQ